ncbi:MAG: SPOR domain-containing protein [Desulfuromonadaceae bacterium]|nr:SPOR domain-containing protein [Desulfuromonadaceae bacterium]
MEFKFSKGGEENLQAEPAAEKKKQSALLLLLLLLVGGFTYIYFFTGIIKPQEVSKPVETPAAQQQVVKMPLPPRDKDAVKTDAKSADVKKVAAIPPKVEPPKIAQASPVASPAPKMPPQPPAKPKDELKKAEPTKPADKKPAVSEKKPAVADKKPVVADKKSEPAKTNVKKAAEEVAPIPKAPPAKSKKPLKAEAGTATSGSTWLVLVGTYVLEDALSTDMGRVRKAGLYPVVKPGARKKTTMNRLFLSEFADRAEAKASLDKLKRHTSDAFVVEQEGKFAVYAGSYLLDAPAASEMERLKVAGFQVSLKRVEVAIPSQKLILGPFGDKKAADAALSKLKAAGVKAALSQQ